MASRINVDTVVNLVSEDVRSAVRSLTVEERPAAAPLASFWSGATVVKDGRRGYLHKLDEQALAQWAAKHGTAIRLLVQQGDYVFPGAPIAVMTVNVPGAAAEICDATALGETRGSAGNAEYAVRQLVEVAVRALSSGINDPHTAMSVLDRLGAALCDIAGRYLPSGVSMCDNAVALVVPNRGYRGLVNVMFHMIRQNAAGSTAVLIRLLDVLTAVIICEVAMDRRAVLAQHADLVWSDAQREIGNKSDLEDVFKRYLTFQRAVKDGALGVINAEVAAVEG